MSTTSPNFAFVLATSGDTVSVTSHISNNFSTLDTLFAVAHTGSGQLKNSLAFTTPTLINPVISGTATGASLVGASTGVFSTITATAGTVTLNSLTANAFSIGTYAYPAAVGSTGTILTIVTGNAVFVAPSGGTGANTGLSNLATVAINTSLNTFTAGFVTINRVIASSGALTGLTVFQATTGTFAGDVLLVGTLNANAVNCTGGAGTFSGLTIGTWSLPTTLGVANSILRSLAGTASWAAPVMIAQTAFSVSNLVSTNLSLTGNDTLNFSVESYDLGNNVTTGVFTSPASGIYEFNFSVVINKAAATTGDLTVGLMIATTAYNFYTTASAGALGNIVIAGALINTVTSGAVVSIYATGTKGGGGSPYIISNTGGPTGHFTGKRLFEF